MSGGSYDYAYQKINDVIRELEQKRYETSTLRKSFRAHLGLISDALKAIEWYDSGDTSDDGESAIKKCLPKNAGIKQAIIDANIAMDNLAVEIERASKID